MNEIPKIIHQIWSETYKPLPEHLRVLGETWKEQHPTWQYELWNNERMERFIQEEYPQYWNIYLDFPYNVQRWDAIRYLILDKIGGMYVDFDSECIKPLDELLLGKTCCFSMEPAEHGIRLNLPLYFNNALIAAVPKHPFMKQVIKRTFQPVQKQEILTDKQRIKKIMTTTGPRMLVEVYEKYPAKEQIYLIPAKFVSPFADIELALIQQGEESEELEHKLDEAYAIHYFFNDWVWKNS